MTTQAQAFQTGIEVDRQAAELAALRRMLDIAAGESSFSIAVCNSPPLRDHLIGELARSHPGVETLSVPPSTTDLFAFASKHAAHVGRRALFIVDFEKSLPGAADLATSLPGDDPLRSALHVLNASRDRWRDVFPVPILIWLPEYGAALLSRHARDFWSLVRHRFEFVIDTVTGAPPAPLEHFDDIDWASNLDATAKQFRIAELEQRLKDAGDPPKEELLPFVLYWLDELGFLYHMVGNLDAAIRVREQSIRIGESLDSPNTVATALGNLGLIYQKRGDLEEAERMHRKALEITEKLGRLEGMANQYGNLGLIHRKRGDLDEAERMHRKALEIEERLGRLKGMASEYGNLGLIYDRRGELEEAMRMHRKSLEIEEKLGWLEGMAGQYGNIALIFRKLGDLDEAERMHRKALEINEKLGRLEGMARDYANLGATYEARAELAEARRLWTLARDIFRKVGMKPEEAKVQSCLDRLPPDQPAP
ncbi:photosystem I assembly protein Ycf3 [Phycisphaerae bacterium RAS1]|nr:photosystem I assembly protein Ycf3 [Phycisphaerae bacterium RAS1]